MCVSLSMAVVCVYGGTHTVYWFALLHGSLRSAPLCSAAAFVTFVTASATLLLFVREFYDLHWINESAPSGRQAPLPTSSDP